MIHFPHQTGQKHLLIQNNFEASAGKQCICHKTSATFKKSYVAVVHSHVRFSFLLIYYGSNT